MAVWDFYSEFWNFSAKRDPINPEIRKEWLPRMTKTQNFNRNFVSPIIISFNDGAKKRLYQNNFNLHCTLWYNNNNNKNFVLFILHIVIATHNHGSCANAKMECISNKM
jgi:hypothetical protein